MKWKRAWYWHILSSFRCVDVEYQCLWLQPSQSIAYSCFHVGLSIYIYFLTWMFDRRLPFVTMDSARSSVVALRDVTKHVLERQKFTLCNIWAIWTTYGIVNLYSVRFFLNIILTVWTWMNAILSSNWPLSLFTRWAVDFSTPQGKSILMSHFPNQINLDIIAHTSE